MFYRDGTVRKIDGGRDPLVKTFTTDPVRGLNEQKLEQEKEEFDKAVLASSKNIKQFRKKNPRVELFDEGTLKKLGKNGLKSREIINKLNTLCLAVGQALIETYKTFDRVCEIHRETAGHVRRGVSLQTE
ncbi:hypothetical protein Pmar_PMAR007043 [Perkinsus marinus ATCC 50983]|uniref:Uncharacterized protein n=1 Tax=Perkinsus marinus (strain ATCC 50983 / TXsc) TaxID=423536 RepID=C5KZL9_PERM5|nr:hypothetical protein Pmar_PMAR007043 [Perkinsus marinus ATCC 50983]EER10047.1 hypothetical protein Pmar_PMAR007043 [Perkinsus marinus ATCC 50983]|eukprot:XP_002778252.1 hypothetical protein Pmar_PMAR007043 [Perkinsus marinus ATCC 50983]